MESIEFVSSVRNKTSIGVEVVQKVNICRYYTIESSMQLVTISLIYSIIACLQYLAVLENLQG